MSDPEVSVLMPVWNGCRNGSDKFLRMSIESILNQTFENLEFIIVNDGSRDGTAGTIEEYKAKDPRIRIVTLPQNMGIQKALNAGLRECRARLVARQDADDMSTVTRLEVQKKFMDDRPATAMCGTGMYVINEDNKLVMEINDRPCNYVVVREALKERCVFVHGSVMFRKSAVLDVGGYSEEERVKHAEDYDLWVRLAKDYSVENIPGVILYFHRNHQSKIGNVYSAKQAAATKLIGGMARQTLASPPLQKIPG